MAGKLERMERLQRHLGLLEIFRLVGGKGTWLPGHHALLFSSYLTDHSSILFARYFLQFINVGVPQGSALIPPLCLHSLLK